VHEPGAVTAAHKAGTIYWKRNPGLQAVLRLLAGPRLLVMLPPLQGAEALSSVPVQEYSRAPKPEAGVVWGWEGQSLQGRREERSTKQLGTEI